MPAYSVHAPAPRDGERSGDPDRFVFVRDGFSVAAFLFTPLWMLARRLWLVLVLYLIVTLVLQGALATFGAPSGVRFATGALVALLVGLEAGTLRRWTLGRRKWRMLGVVVGQDRESAEQRFFGAWVEQQTRGASTPVTPPPSSPNPSSPGPSSSGPRSVAGESGILGLFPRPILSSGNAR